MTWQKSENKNLGGEKSQKLRWIWNEHKIGNILQKTKEEAVGRDYKGQENETKERLKKDWGERRQILKNGKWDSTYA